MKDILEGKTILVTGGTGSIGSEIVRQLLRYDVSKIIVFSRDEIKHFLMKKTLSDNRLEFIIGDIRIYNDLERIFSQNNIDIIYHAAAMKHVVVCEDVPIQCVKTNIIGTQNIVDLASKYRVPKLINISTDKSAGPINVMGASKFIAERIVLNANYSCVRFGNVANSRGSVIPVFIENLLNQKPLQVTDPSITRFMIEIPDAVKLVIKATKYTKGGDIFILKMNSFKLGDLVDVIAERIAPKLGINQQEITIQYTGIEWGEKLHEDLINHLESDRVYELENMYIIVKNEKCLRSYKNIKKIKVNNYSSNQVRLFTKDELERIMLNYISKIYFKFWV